MSDGPFGIPPLPKNFEPPLPAFGGNDDWYYALVRRIDTIDAEIALMRQQISQLNVLLSKKGKA